MKPYIVAFQISVPIEPYNKLCYITEYNGWSINRQINRFIKNEIAVFERKHGEIILPDEDEK